MKHLRRGNLPNAHGGLSESNTNPWIPQTKTERPQQRKKGDRYSREVNAKAHKRSNHGIELGPNVNIHVADLFIASLPNAPPPETALQLLCGLQEGRDGLLHGLRVRERVRSEGDFAFR